MSEITEKFINASDVVLDSERDLIVDDKNINSFICEFNKAISNNKFMIVQSPTIHLNSLELERVQLMAKECGWDLIYEFGFDSTYTLKKIK